jgi:hypothetical protein
MVDFANRSNHIESLNAIRNKVRTQERTKEGIQDMSAGHTRVSGQFMLNAPGEAVIPVKFSEKPTMSFGSEMRESDPLQPGFYPQLSCSVAGWFTEDSPPNLQLYTGCNLVVVMLGPPTLRMYVHWHMEGNAFTNPV